jgi:WD40 repeat protein
VRLWNLPGRFLAAVLPGHAGGVTCVAYAPGGRQIASAGRDKTVKLRNVTPPTVRALATIQGDKAAPWFALYAPDGRGLATGGKDKAVRLHDPGAGRTGGVLPGRFSRVKWAAFAPDGATLALACQDKTVRLWDVATRTLKATLEGHKLPVMHTAFAPDGKTLASTAGLDNNRGNTERGGLGELKLWDLTTGKEKASLMGHNEGVFAVAFAPDGKTLASASGDGTVKLWDPATAKERLTLEGHEADVRAVNFSPDGKALATGGDDGTIRFWEPVTGKQIRQIEVGDFTTNAVAFSRDGNLLAAAVAPPDGKGMVRVWEVDTGKPRADLKVPFVSALAFAPDGKTVVLGVGSALGPSGKEQPGGVQIWDVNSNSLLTTLHGGGAISTVAFAPDGRTMVSAGGGSERDEGEVRFWLVSQARRECVLEGHDCPVGCAAYSPDGKTLATGGHDKTIRLWDVDSGRERATLRGFANPPLRVRFSPDGKIVHGSQPPHAHSPGHVRFDGITTSAGGN